MTTASYPAKRIAMASLPPAWDSPKLPVSGERKTADVLVTMGKMVFIGPTEKMMG